MKMKMKIVNNNQNKITNNAANMLFLVSGVLSVSSSALRIVKMHRV